MKTFGSELIIKAILLFSYFFYNYMRVYAYVLSWACSFFHTLRHLFSRRSCFSHSFNSVILQRRLIFARRNAVARMPRDNKTFHLLAHNSLDKAPVYLGQCAKGSRSPCGDSNRHLLLHFSTINRKIKYKKYK